MNPIHHPHENKSNGLRERLAACTGRSQRTFTPSLAVIERAEGVYLYTPEGKRLTDFASGVLVTNLGHSHRLFEERYAAYINGLPRSSYNMLTPIEVDAAERLLENMALGNGEQILWAASGSEAIQKAMWCCLHHNPGRHIMLATRFGFHGKKGLANDVTGDASPNPNVRFISFPMEDEKESRFYEAELNALWEEFPDKIALLITEPYLGAAGSFHPPAWYMQLLQRWCNDHDVPFILDEVQSCHGRTGNMYAYQSYDIEPDIVVLGKGLGNGEPVAAAAGRRDLISALDYGGASDTFSGTPRACAAVCAVLDVFEREPILDNVRKLAPRLREHLDNLAADFPFVTKVRGEGFVYGLECANSEMAMECVLEAYNGVNGQGVHLLGPLADKVLRISPPLTITVNQLDEAFDLLHQSLRRIEILAEQA